MSKRFTDTEKWQRPWFRQLPWMYRELWLYILDSCDIAGIWYVDFDLARFCISQDLNLVTATELFEKQIRILGDGKKWWVEGFVDFQYGTLNDSSNLHKSVISKLIKAGIWSSPQTGLEQALIDPTSSHMVKDKEEVKNKEKEKEREQENWFNQFWSVYPRKDDKSSSRKAWNKIDVTEDLLKTILSKIEKAKETDQWNRDDGQYIPLPTTWLNKRRWENEGVLISALSKADSSAPVSMKAYNSTLENKNGKS